MAERVKEHIEEVKEYWQRNLSFLDYFKKVLGRDDPLPAWTDADIQEFVTSDPVYGPQVDFSHFEFCFDFLIQC